MGYIPFPSAILIYVLYFFNCFFDGCMEKDLLPCLLEREIKSDFLPFTILKCPKELVATYYFTKSYYLIYSIQSVMEIFQKVKSLQK